MGIGSGSWVGLMLGNVPDFVILALALSKIDAVVVPLDPTTGNRELEMVLEAAPLRALITRPRGGELHDRRVGVGERRERGALVEAASQKRALQAAPVLRHELRRRAGTRDRRRTRRRRIRVERRTRRCLSAFTATRAGDRRRCAR